MLFRVELCNGDVLGVTSLHLVDLLVGISAGVVCVIAGHGDRAN